MPAAHVKELGRAYTSGNSSQSVVTLTAGAPVGNTVILACKGSVGYRATGAVDSRGNVYTVDVFSEESGNTQTLISAPITTALQVGDTITVTYEGSAAAHTVFALEYSGILAAAGRVEDWDTSGGSAILSLTVGPVTVTDPDSIVVAAVSFNANEGMASIGAGFVSNTHYANNGVTLSVADYDPAAAGDVSGTWTKAGATTRNWGGCLAVYKPAGRAPVATLAPWSSSRMSDEAGWDQVTSTITADQTFVEYELRAVAAESTARLSGTLVEAGGPFAATDTQAVTLTYAELAALAQGEMTYRIKAFVKNADGTWSS